MDIGVPGASGVFQKLLQFTTPMRPIGKTQFLSFDQNTFYLKLIGLRAAVAGVAGRLDDGDSSPRDCTPGVVYLVAATTSYVQP